MSINHAVLEIRQSLPLVDKIIKTKLVLKNFIDNVAGGQDKVYVAFSGGKDSLVLCHLIWRKFSRYFPEYAHEILDYNFPNVTAVFIDTGVELPEIRQFVLDMLFWHPIEIIKPKISFYGVVKKYGYPMISKEQSQFISQYRNALSEKTKDTRLNGNKYGRGKISKKWLFYIDDDAPMVSDVCCNHLKKDPAKRYEKATGRLPILGIMADESSLRTQKYLKHGCTIVDAKRVNCTPLAFWTDKDIWELIKLAKIYYCSVYDDPDIDRTGCSGCGFGCVSESRFDKFKYIARNHPRWFKLYWETCGLKHHYKLITGKERPDWLDKDSY